MLIPFLFRVPDSAPASAELRWLTPVGVGLLGLLGLGGLIWLVRGALDSFFAGPSVQADLGGNAGTPLLVCGLAAVVVALQGMAMVRAFRGHSPQVRVGLLLGSAVMVSVFLVFGELTSLSRADPWPGYHQELAQLPAPGSWTPLGLLDQGRGGSSEAPGAARYWVAAGLSAGVTCTQLRSALAAWSGTSDISSGYARSGLSCELAGRHNGLGVSASVAPSLALLGAVGTIPVPATSGARGPVVAVQLYYRG